MNKLISMLGTVIIPNISDVVVEALAGLLEGLEVKARSTSNPYDEMLVAALKAILIGLAAREA